jgi:hypothetical protein
MGLAAFKTCGAPGCPVLVKGGNRCPKHLAAHKKKTYTDRNQDEVSKWYRTARWVRFREWFLRNNPICQRIVSGKRCERIATLLHHHKSPREYPELFLDADNCAALCADHHHAHEGDAPDDVFVPSFVDD